MLTIAGAARLVSDLHLRRERPDLTRRFATFLADTAASNVDTLFILGDLFEYWIGDDDLTDSFNAEVCALLRGTAESGTCIGFIAGNRDFLIGERFAASSRLTLLPEATVIALAGTATLLLHGDTLCTDDTDYLAFRATVRDPRWQREFLALPLAERRRQIEALRQRSETAKDGKPHALMDANAEAIAAAFRTHGASRIIHGHTHRQARHEHIVDGRNCERWVLGDWGETGNALAADSTGCRWVAIGA